MPMYEYRCLNCGAVFEKLRKFSDEPLTVHEACGGKVERLLSAPAFQFKGSGFYITAYAKGSAAGPKPAEKKDDGGAEAKPAAATESKPAATATTPAPAPAAKSE